MSGIVRIFAGQPDFAIEHVETSLRLSPRERMGAPLVAMGEAYFFKRQFARRRRSCSWPFKTIPGFPLPYGFLAACYADLGRIDEAGAIVARLRAISPLVIPGDLPFRNPEDRELLLSGLRLAMAEAT